MRTGQHRRTGSCLAIRGIIASGAGALALALPLVSATVSYAATTNQPPIVPNVQLITYKTVAGDTLPEIAKRYPSSGGWKKLYGANRAVIGDNPGHLRAGLTLTVGTKTLKGPAEASAAAQASAATYANNLDGWIKQSLNILGKAGIPGSYDGIYRNVMRESSGNPQAINNWDSNAVAGTPSKGLLQVIDPTFQAYHVAGTSMDPYDPVANITAACNYAADKYGSIDNVNGAY
ncbi:LysM peptidoglycan-binding domain-containing protein [Streptomyces sp. NPDC055109]